MFRRWNRRNRADSQTGRFGAAVPRKRATTGPWHSTAAWRHRAGPRWRRGRATPRPPRPRALVTSRGQLLDSGSVSVVLTEAVQRAVSEAVEALNGELERAVTVELDRQLAALAAGMLADRLGVVVASTEPTTRTDNAAKVCRSCGESKEAAAFDRHRRICKQCRRGRSGRSTAPTEGDRPGADASIEPTARG